MSVGSWRRRTSEGLPDADDVWGGAKYLLNEQLLFYQGVRTPITNPALIDEYAGAGGGGGAVDGLLWIKTRPCPGHHRFRLSGPSRGGRHSARGDAPTSCSTTIICRSMALSHLRDLRTLRIAFHARQSFKHGHGTALETRSSTGAQELGAWEIDPRLIVQILGSERPWSGRCMGYGPVREFRPPYAGVSRRCSASTSRGDGAIFAP